MAQDKDRPKKITSSAAGCSLACPENEMGYSDDTAFLFCYAQAGEKGERLVLVFNSIQVSVGCSPCQVEKQGRQCRGPMTGTGMR